MKKRTVCFYLCAFLAVALSYPALASAQRDNDRGRDRGRGRDNDVLPGPGWQVMRAEWGAGDRRVDVTERVRALLSSNGQVKVNNTNLGGDPAEGAKKVLRIRARNFRGDSRKFEFREGDYIDAGQFYNYGGGVSDESGGGWRVMRAEWGAGNRGVDVTERVRALLSGEGSVKVNNTNLGGDPAEGAKKVLRISARDEHGTVRQFSFTEGEYIDASQFYNYRRYSDNPR